MHYTISLQSDYASYILGFDNDPDFLRWALKFAGSGAIRDGGELRDFLFRFGRAFQGTTGIYPNLGDGQWNTEPHKTFGGYRIRITVRQETPAPATAAADTMERIPA